MNHDDRELEPNTPPPGRLEIDALLDGEPVDKESLRFALDSADARDYLIDTLLLRQLAIQMGPSRFVAPGRPHSPFARGMRWMAASLLLAIGAGGGYAYGLRSHAVPSSPPRTAAEISPAPTAPEPTRIIRFEPGVNWTSTAGSN